MSATKADLFDRGNFARAMFNGLKHGGQDLAMAAKAVMRLVRLDIDPDSPDQPFREFYDSEYPSSAKLVRFDSIEDFCKEWLRSNPEDVVHKLSLFPEAQRCFTTAWRKLARQAEAQTTSKKAESLVANGGDRTPQSDNIRLNRVGPPVSKAGGTSAPYLAARLKRDAPEIAKQLEEGRFPSVRAAAKAAGLVRDPTPLELLQKAWRKASPKERAAFLEEVAK